MKEYLFIFVRFCLLLRKEIKLTISRKYAYLYKIFPKHTAQVPYLISFKILEISNSFLFLVDKKTMKEFVEFFFYNFKLHKLFLNSKGWSSTGSDNALRYGAPQWAQSSATMSAIERQRAVWIKHVYLYESSSTGRGPIVRELSRCIAKDSIQIVFSACEARQYGGW